MKGLRVEALGKGNDFILLDRDGTEFKNRSGRVIFKVVFDRSVNVLLFKGPLKTTVPESTYAQALTA
jgi:hypothetical protein